MFLRIASLLLLISTCQAYATPKVFKNDLVLRGEVKEVRKVAFEHGDHRYSLKLRLEFYNGGTEASIIVKPFNENILWYGGFQLAKTEDDANAFRYIHAGAAWPSIYPFPLYEELAKRLDKPTPPSEATVVIQPKESWYWETDGWFYLEDKPFSLSRQGLSYLEIQKLAQPLWLRVSFEMWPFNVENFKPGLGGKLRKRWQKYGQLFLVEKSGRYWFGHLTTQPMALDLTKVL